MEVSQDRRSDHELGLGRGEAFVFDPAGHSVAARPSRSGSAKCWHSSPLSAAITKWHKNLQCLSKTASVHVFRIIAKLGVTNGTEAAAVAHCLPLIE